jgi:2-furoyl-CoA dehydrogenase large subunit
MTVQSSQEKRTEQTYVGVAYPRLEDLRLTTGKAKFLDDLSVPPGTHYAVILRSPYAHAKIKRIDTEDAIKVPGVRAVLTAAELLSVMDPLPLALRSPIRYYPIATDRARYAGEPVAVVIARSRAIAEDAASKVNVDYEPLQVVADIEKALAQGAPKVHEAVGSNTVWKKTFSYGDVGNAFEQAAKVVSVDVRVNGYTVPPMETFGVVAEYDKGSDVLTEWCNFIGPFTLAYVVAKALRLSQDRFRVIVPGDIGGSFGTKLAVYPYMALVGACSIFTGVPVKWIETRMEHFVGSTRAATRLSHLEMALSADGDFLGLKARITDDIGAYPRSPEPGHLLKSVSNFTGPYKISNLEISGEYVTTNTLPTSPIRAFGRPHLCIPLEKLVDKCAKITGNDPLELRRRNFIQPRDFPYTTASGGVYDSGDYGAAIEKLKKIFDLDGARADILEKRREGRLVGLGIAVGIEPSVSNMAYLDLAIPEEERQKATFMPHSGGQHSATLKIEPDGHIVVRLDSCPQGQGHETVAAQLVASVLGVNPEDVRVLTGVDTFNVSWSISSGTYASRFGSLGISAVYSAALDMRKKLAEAASKLLGVSADDIVMENGVLFSKSRRDLKISSKRLVGTVYWNPGSDALKGGDHTLSVTRTFNVETLGPATLDNKVNASATYGFIGTAAAVEVDRDTGSVSILKYASVHDSGGSINPGIVEQLCVGAANQAASHALHQELIHDDSGQPLNITFGDYYVRTAEDFFTPIFGSAAKKSPFTPLGTKGVSEGDNMTGPAALLIAIQDALYEYNADIDTVPFTAERIWSRFLSKNNLGESASSRSRPA